MADQDGRQLDEFQASLTETVGKSGGLFLEIAYGFANRRNLLRVFVRDGQIELLLKLHDELDGVEGVGAEVVGEGGVAADLALGRSSPAESA